MNKMNPKVDEYLSKTPQWQAEIAALRAILLDCGLSEEWKWYTPCYTIQDNNVVLIYKFKEYMGIGFFKGSLLKDPQHILQKQGENSRAVRLIKFTKVDEIVALTTVLKDYILEAIEVEKAGLQVDLKAGSELVYPDELKQIFNENKALENAFESLTPGRKRAYIIYFTGSKQTKTRIARIEKYIPMIMDGKGLNDY